MKILAKVIASRLLECLSSLVHSDQVGFVPDRQAPDAARRVIHQVTLVRAPSLLLSLEAEKAFDRVHWGFLKAVLTKFDINGWLQSAILSLYSYPATIVLMDRTLSRPFEITDGTQQGLPSFFHS